MNALWYNQMMEYYSALTRNELLNHEKKRRNLKCILRERNQSEKYKPIRNHAIPTIRYSGKGKTMETVKRSVIARHWKGDKEAECSGFLGQ